MERDPYAWPPAAKTPPNYRRHALQLPADLDDRLSAESERRCIHPRKLIAIALERALQDWEAQEL